MTRELPRARGNPGELEWAKGLAIGLGRAYYVSHTKGERDRSPPLLTPLLRFASSSPMPLDRELMRGAGPVAVLKLLERREMYGYELVEALEARTEGVLAMGQSTLYPMLYNLEAKGLVASRWDESGPRGRKYYRLTASGKQRLADDSAQWKAVTGAMKRLGIVGRLAATRLFRPDQATSAACLGCHR